MKKLFMLSFIAIILSGCATATSRLEKCKNQNINTSNIEVNCNIPTAKRIAKEAIREVNLVERPNLEKENFIFASTGCGTYWKTALIAPKIIRVGVFFDYNQESENTKITVSDEEVKGNLLSLALSDTPIRYAIIEKIKLKSAEISKNNP